MKNYNIRNVRKTQNERCFECDLYDGQAILGHYKGLKYGYEFKVQSDDENQKDSIMYDINGYYNASRLAKCYFGKKPDLDDFMILLSDFKRFNQIAEALVKESPMIKFSIVIRENKKNLKRYALLTAYTEVLNHKAIIKNKYETGDYSVIGVFDYQKDLLNL